MFTDGFGTVRIDAEASGPESDLAASRIEASGCHSAFGALSTGTGFGVPVPRARGGHQGEREKEKRRVGSVKELLHRSVECDRSARTASGIRGEFVDFFLHARVCLSPHILMVLEWDF